ncbi:HU family DNA-binding protein [Phaeovulum sp.]|uniref:HU family DNA-binding protein n=1 Tax=Phaeovulum sp. TaxID=2934796 RepID=UPI0039E48050
MKTGAPPAVKTPAPLSTDKESAADTVTLRKKDLLDRVVAATGAGKKEARDVIEATLRILGDALAARETVVVPPLGKARVSRQVDRKMGEMLIVKLIRPSDTADKNSAKTEDEALAVANDCG